MRGMPDNHAPTIGSKPIDRGVPEIFAAGFTSELVPQRRQTVENRDVVVKTKLGRFYVSRVIHEDAFGQLLYESILPTQVSTRVREREVIVEQMRKSLDVGIQESLEPGIVSGLSAYSCLSIAHYGSRFLWGATPQEDENERKSM